MASAGPVESFHDEASCSICLGFFQDPVSIHCGHNFCRSCITRCWEEAESAFPCPQCKETAPQRNLRPNRELAKIIEIAKRLSLQAAKGGAGGEKLCEKHQEALKLFCEEDRTPICLVCRESQAHRAHAVVPIEEAAEEYKEKFQAHVQILKDKREKLLGLKTAEEGKSLNFLERVETERQKVVSEIEELHQFVEGQEHLLLGRLAELDQEIVKRQEENITRLSEEIASISEDIRELEEKCQQPASEFLQDSRSILSRLEKEDVQNSEKVSPELEEKPTGCPQKNIALKEMLMKFQVSLTLDPETAHPRLVLSEDRKSVRWEDTRQPVPDNPKRFDASRCVLGCEGFSAGRHYWEVEVGDGEAWAVGVAKESVRRKGRISVNPEVGIWAMGQCGSQYQALTSPTIPISLLAPPKAIGIYLDYEEGRVAFFDADNEAPIFTYPPALFAGERILPLLCLGRGCQFTLSP
ncbi:E3 ubiquitin-protein ligase TRIM39-like isoform X2 [Apteryx rowi]|nr:PREDICTED: E3 ubiquitin-protein ligase TRIM39-like [Apteryx mantelli mantelli]XP_025947911.1 E3 ubiquitin-protein ligase TRIM39-like isoform X2 [Apteryx rowi]XP_025947912.1 E3 ubiquitin-protein ligase TRIM39-like isoform X2 [Apteryx rowi]XP_025947913.1 E3 ubiquitin-protein ligase TRIM39-like isoform X2 [Apteryx rowi]XP_025947915.1 E3 ubiquitin-protein ligase TRIM39-like isoform X2 [Apteryx rowi]